MIAVRAPYVPCTCGTPPTNHSTFSHVVYSIGSGRWNKTALAYLFPATPLMAEAVNDGLAGQQVQADGEFGRLVFAAAQIHAAGPLKTAETLPEIPGIVTKPWLHQKRAYWFAHDVPAANLGMDPGTGKTLVGIALMRARNVQTALVVTKRKGIAVWPSEIAKHAPDWRPHIEPLTDDAVATRTRAAEQALALAGARSEPFVLVTNYDAVWREPLASWLRTIDWGQIVLDEIHRIKLPSGKASSYLWRLGHRARFRLGLTGTPLPHSLLDGFAQCRFLDEGLFGSSYYLFKQHYTVPHPVVQGALHPKQPFKNEAEFHRKFFTLTYRVTDDVLDLPPEMALVIDVDLPKAAQDVYRKLEKEFVA